MILHENKLIMNNLKIDNKSFKKIDKFLNQYNKKEKIYLIK